MRGYCSRRLQAQSFGHVFQVLIKLYDQKETWLRKPKALFNRQGGYAAETSADPNFTHLVEEGGKTTTTNAVGRAVLAGGATSLLSTSA